MPTISDLRQRQALPLRAKVLMTQNRIREWYNHFDGDVYVSFSGGKDSTVLAHLVNDIYPDVPLVFSNTGLEYPEIQTFAKKMDAEFIRPKMMFSEVISKYGYPIISKETSEAINGARRIKKANQLRGGWKWTPQKRAELMGERKKKDSGLIGEENPLPG
jgi:3'-phosphoadenosine 5'-phosphosulfate sulfotransferase (PAPS reductase)/FAD synthetase